eukprot:m51a1_g7679 hypothetical protein (345) ;mRNA; f:7816-8930
MCTRIASEADAVVRDLRDFSAWAEREVRSVVASARAPPLPPPSSSSSSSSSSSPSPASASSSTASVAVAPLLDHLTEAVEGAEDELQALAACGGLADPSAEQLLALCRSLVSSHAAAVSSFSAALASRGPAAGPSPAPASSAAATQSAGTWSASSSLLPALPASFRTPSVADAQPLARTPAVQLAAGARPGSALGLGLRACSAGERVRMPVLEDFGITRTAATPTGATPAARAATPLQAPAAGAPCDAGQRRRISVPSEQEAEAAGVPQFVLQQVGPHMVACVAALNAALARSAGGQLTTDEAMSALAAAGQTSSVGKALLLALRKMGRIELKMGPGGVQTWSA